MQEKNLIQRRLASEEKSVPSPLQARNRMSGPWDFHVRFHPCATDGYEQQRERRWKMQGKTHPHSDGKDICETSVLWWRRTINEWTRKMFEMEFSELMRFVLNNPALFNMTSSYKLPCASISFHCCYEGCLGKGSKRSPKQNAFTLQQSSFLIHLATP